MGRRRRVVREWRARMFWVEVSGGEEVGRGEGGVEMGGCGVEVGSGWRSVELGGGEVWGW